ncbi:peptidase MA family metallohydrolase [Nitrospira sp. NS4]|uniref:peptidase MA family metallohydrolase n=1 Tax=Nitrospira sp. NS4 TaxID=3414498 RepID=UPI003C2AC189
MYRRNIFHILLPLALCLGVFTTYHLFVKDLSPATPEAPAPVVDSAPSPSIPIVSQAPARPTDEELKQARAIDPAVIPDTPSSQLLEAVRDEIERKNFTVAERRLANLPPSLLSDAKAKPYIAILWNNLGLEQERIDGTKASVKAFKKAAALDSANPVIQLNLAHAYWELRDPALNQDFLTALTSLAPNEPFPHLAMADLLYDQDHLTEAAAHLAEATERAGKDPRVQSYLAAVTAKVRHTDAVESRMHARNSAHFMVKYDGAEDHGTWTTVLEILEEAYRDIGQRFSHFPAKPIVVVLHTKDTFQSATGSPAWADGLYDPVLGRIQIPTQGATTDTQWLTHVLRHEYVHALLHDRLEGQITSLPVWLNEGLAMQLAGDPWPDLDQAMPNGGSVIHLKYLEGGWGQLPQNAATLAYLEANSATHYLIERFGMSRVAELLNAFKAKATVATALQDKIFLSYDQFHQQWLDTFLHKHS